MIYLIEPRFAEHVWRSVHVQIDVHLIAAAAEADDVRQHRRGLKRAVVLDEPEEAGVELLQPRGRVRVAGRVEAVRAREERIHADIPVLRGLADLIG